jgi:hypothetical protein
LAAFFAGFLAAAFTVPVFVLFGAAFMELLLIVVAVGLVGI